MKLVEIQEWITENSEIGIDLDAAAREVPRLHGRAINIRSNEIGILRALELEEESRRKERWVFYSGKADPKMYKEEPFDLKVLKSEVDMFIDSDKKISDIKSKIASQKIKIELLDEFIKQLNGRSFLISNIINYQKLMNGLS